MGSSGYRKIPGNTCKGGVQKDKPVEKSCSNGGFLIDTSLAFSRFTLFAFLVQPAEGEIIHQVVCEIFVSDFPTLMSLPPRSLSPNSDPKLLNMRISTTLL